MIYTIFLNIHTLLYLLVGSGWGRYLRSHNQDLCSEKQINKLTYCVVFLFCFSSSCGPYVANFSVFSIFDCPFGIL